MNLHRYRRTWLVFLMFFILLLAEGFIVGAKKGIQYYKKGESERSIVRRVEDMDSVTKILADQMTIVAEECANEQYRVMKLLIDNGCLEEKSEKDLSRIYRQGYIGRLNREFGFNSYSIRTRINEILKDNDIENIRVLEDDDILPTFKMMKDGSGNIVSAEYADIALEYEDDVSRYQGPKCSFEVQFPNPQFREGNEDLLSYCMLAKKGIYITGQTSSIVGNVYAGEHSAEDCRDAEALYGEIGAYGGLNIFSTEVGFKSDRIISESNINLNGAFVIFSPEHEKVKCFAKSLNEIQGYNRQTQYSMSGDLYEIDKVTKEIQDEYLKQKELMDLAVTGFEEIGLFYDSKNDEKYHGTYRKIISTESVELSEDFEGVVLTPQSVIVDQGVSVQGLLLTSDRIYLQGDNAIVYDYDIVRTMLKEEKIRKDEIQEETENGDSSVEISLDMDVLAGDRIPEQFIRDYIELMSEDPGMYPPDAYIIPSIE